MARKMKDSGIEWIGEIPEGWEVLAHKYIMHKEKSICEHYSGEDVISLTLNGVVKRDLENPFGKMPTTFDGYQFVDPNDLLLCLFDIDVTPRCVGLVKDYGVTSPAYSRFKIHSGFCNAYYNYLLRFIDDEKVFVHLSKNLRSSLTESDFGAIKTIVPPKAEQQRIADYLDNRTFEIDTLLSKARSSIEEYKKLKQAVITQAVTKGVRGEREMKDSGVDWIGAIPKDWEIKRLKSFCTIVDCKNRTPDVFPDGKYTVVRTTCIKDCSFSYEGSYQTDTTNFKAWTLKGQPHKGDIFFTREAPVGEACLVPNADNLCMGQRVMFFRPEDNSDARYIMYSIYGPLVREYIASKNSGSTVGHLKLGQVACIPIFYCPPLEQKEIADYLDAKCAEIDRLIAKKEQLVKELEGYKKSLIYEVVTGKREV